MKTRMINQPKPLLYAIAGFVAGVLLAYFAGQANSSHTESTMSSHSHMESTMDAMTGNLEGKTGDEFDEVFLSEMIVHHQGAIEMSRDVVENSHHPELKNFADRIIETQTKEVDQMKQWQHEWGYHTEH